MIQSVYRDNLYAGKVALVTGGGTGIGLRIATELVQLGAVVAICGRRADVLAAAVQTLGSSAFAVPLNVRDAQSVDDGVRSVVQRAGRLDFLINNAGGQFLSPAADISRKGWDAVLETNLTGPFQMAQAAFRHAFREHGGAIVSVLANVERGFPLLAHTGAARAGVANLTRSLAVEWGRYGVRVNAVAPGVIDTSGLDAYGPAAETVRGYARFNVTTRLGTAAEVANAVLFFLTPMAQFLTGTVLAVDGGESLYSPILPPAKTDRLPPVE